MRTRILANRLCFRLWKQLIYCAMMYAAGIFWGQPLYAQQHNEILSLPVTVKAHQVSLSELLQLLRKQVNVQFIYTAGKATLQHRITLDMTGEPLSRVLDRALQGTSQEYVVTRGIVIIRQAMATGEDDSQDSLLRITGTVIDDNGQPLPRASVVLPNSSAGTYTNEQGRYTITAPFQGVLRFSCLGYEPIQVPIEGRSQIRVQLKSQVQDMGEVYITGYQQMLPWEMTGSVSQVKGSQLLQPGVNRVDQLLQGRIPGVNVMINSGGVGANPQIRIRGTATLVGNREPIWVVDGIVREDPAPYQGQHLTGLMSREELASLDAGLSIRGNSISGLNPSDIEDITFLKDAAATAIYGSRAANGVIVVTTKKGKPGPPQLYYRTDITVTSQPTYRRRGLMNSAERVAFSREIYEKGIIFPDENLLLTGYEGAMYRLLHKEIDQATFNRQIALMEKNNTDWFDVLFRNGLSNNHYLSISGGSDRLSYRASGGYTNEKGSAMGNEMKRVNALLRVDARPHKIVTLGLIVNASSRTTKGFYEGLNPYEYAYMTNRALGVNEHYYASMGELYEPDDLLTGRPNLQFNFLQELQHTGNTSRNHSVNAALTVGLQLLPTLRIESMFAPSYERTLEQRWADDQSYAVSLLRKGPYIPALFPPDLQPSGVPSPRPGISDEDQLSKKAYTWRNIATYTPALGARRQHEFNLMAGTEVRSTTYSRVTSRDRNIAHYKLLPSKDIPEDYSTGRLLTNYVSLLGSAAYVYDRKYTVSLNARYDASNRFTMGSKQRFNPVWSAGVRWDVLQEHWASRWQFPHALVLKASYGHQGNTVETISPYISTHPVNFSRDPLTGNFFLGIRQLSNPMLGWEKTRTWNTGLELALADGKVQLNFDYYHRLSTDIISRKALPQEYGIKEMYINESSISNTGWEASIVYTALDNKQWHWILQLQASRNKNRVSNIRYTPNQLALVSGDGLINDMPVGGLWSFPYTGLSGEDGQPQFQYLDVDKDPSLLKGDQPMRYMRYSGSTEPIMNGGFYTQLQYKQFSFTASFNVQLEYYRRLDPLAPAGGSGYFRPPAPDRNVSQELVHRWQKPGDERYTNIPSIYSFNYYPNHYSIGDQFRDLSLSRDGSTLYRYTLYNYSDLRTVNASHIRCNFLSLGYNVVSKTLPLLRNMKQVALSISVNNAFVIADKRLKGQDPEMAGISASENSTLLPRTRSYSFSLGITL